MHPLRGWLCAGLALIACYPAAAGFAAQADATADITEPEDSGQNEPRTATVILQDGQVLTGELIEESPERIVLSINGVRTTIDQRRIRESYIQPPVEQRYRAIRATIADDDVDGLIQIADWLLTKNRPDLALADLELALRTDPFAHRARELRVIAREALRLQESRDPEPADETPTEPAAGSPREPAGSFPLITEDDVNLLRVYEVDLDQPPRMTIDREIMEDVLREFAGQAGVPPTAAGREALLAAPAVDQLAVLFTLRAREYYGRVRVQGEPAALRRFRDDVYRTWLRNACATTRCHGGAEAGRLQFARSARMDPQVYLTNFLILDRYRTEQGEAIIDYDEPASSLLLQAGLPKHAATRPHPDVAGWRPVFRGLTDGRFQQAVTWIRSMYVPRPDYPVDYTPQAPLRPEDAQPAPPR